MDINPKTILDDANKLVKQLADAKSKQAANDTSAKETSVTTTTNPFPIEVFPPAVQQVINATHTHLNFPIDYIGASMLYAASVAVGNTHRVEVKTGWVETAVLYMAIVGRAGTNKSQPLTFALQPLLSHDKKTYLLYEQQRQEYEKALSQQKKDKDYLDEPVKPYWHKYLLTDFTPEALAEVHKFNKRGIGVYADELAGWFKNFNRYNKGSEMEFWLSVWSGKPINIDRKTGEPIFIPLPYIAVAGTIQNGLLNELAKDSRTENGFVDRILFVIPGNIQKQYWNETDMDTAHINTWHSIINNLLNITVDYDDTYNPIPHTLTFSPEAKKILYAWQKQNTDQSNTADNETISGIYSKIEMYTIRLALILEMLRYACNQSAKSAISAEAVQGAIKLAEYFKSSALKINAIMNNDNPLANYPIDKQAVYNALPALFTTVDGVAIAESTGMPGRTFQYFLNDKVLFKSIKRGVYEKNM